MIRNIPTIPAAVALRLPHRIRVFLRRATNEGALSLLSGFFLLGLAAIFARIAWTSWTDYKSALRRAIHQSAAENAPTGDDMRFGILAQFLGPINADPDRWIAHLQDAHGTVEQLAAWLAQQSLTFRIPSPKQPTLDLHDASQNILRGALVTFALPSLDQDSQDSWVTSFANDLAAIRDDSVQAELHALPKGIATARELLLGPMFTKAIEPDDRSVLIIPSRTASFLRQSAFLPFHVPTTTELCAIPQIRMAVQISELLDRAIDLTISPNAASREGEAPVQSYFISSGSVLRLWSRALLASPVENWLSPSRLWARAHYFDRLLLTDLDSYWTPAYIDYAGHGIVFTHSVPVIARPIGSDDSSGEFLGIFASDYAVPVEQLLADPAANPLLGICFAVVPRAGPSSPDKIPIYKYIGTPVKSSSYAEDSANTKSTDHAQFFLDKERWEEATDDESVRIKRAIAQKSGATILERGITPLPVGTEEAYCIPVLDLGPERFGAVILTPQVGKAPVEAQIASILAAVAGGSALCLVFLGFAQSRRADVLLTRLSVLRNLQVGVLIVGPKDEILEVNDRAEELLHESLPKTGVWDERMVRTRRVFADLIRPTIVLEDRKTVAKYEHIWRARQDGRPSTYYVQLLNGEWLRVSGTPLLGNWDPAEMRTFGIIDALDKQGARELMDAIKGKEL